MSATTRRLAPLLTLALTFSVATALAMAAARALAEAPREAPELAPEAAPGPDSWGRSDLSGRGEGSETDPGGAIVGPTQSAPPAALTLGERALELVRVLADDIGSRPAGSASELRAARLIADEFAAIGYTVDSPSFPFAGRELTFPPRTSTGTSRNVMAWDASEDPNAPLVIVGAHYDSVSTGPGANDNASGTAVVLELARELAAQPIPGVAVRYVAFGAEEVGLVGSRYLANGLSRADRARLRLMMSIDMMAVGEQPAFVGSEPWVTHAVARAESQGWSPVRLPPAFGRLSDHGPFLDAGLPAMMFHWVEDPCWHLACDISERVQYPALELMGAIAIELIRIAAE